MTQADELEKEQQDQEIHASNLLGEISSLREELKPARARIATLEAQLEAFMEALKEIADSGRLDLADDPCWVQGVARDALMSALRNVEGEKDDVE